MLHKTKKTPKLLFTSSPFLWIWRNWRGPTTKMGKAHIHTSLCLLRLPLIIEIDCEGKKGERWNLPPHHLSTSSKQLDWQWGNYAVIITRTCAQAYLFPHYINIALCTPDGVPDVCSLMASSLLRHTSPFYHLPVSAFLFYTTWGEFSLLGKLTSSRSWSGPACVCVCGQRVRERQRAQCLYFCMWRQLLGECLPQLITSLWHWFFLIMENVRAVVMPCSRKGSNHNLYPALLCEMLRS